VTVKEYELVGTINCSFKTFGGTESVVNDQLTVVDTANVETWYRPDITSASQIRVGTKKYEVMGEPEDIEQRHQFLKFKVRGVKGGT
jgi:SPP1 family predicted phage head-tail adaptor